MSRQTRMLTVTLASVAAWLGWATAMVQAEGGPAPVTKAAPAAGPAPFANNACVNCHRDLPQSSEIVDPEWKRSVHYAANVGCEGCHGGNATLRQEQFANKDEFKKATHLNRDNPDFLLTYPRKDEEFVSNVTGRQVSYFCGKCHADIKEKHLGSPHGAFGAPTCLYCHAQQNGKLTHLITHPTPDIIDTRSRAEGGRCSPCHRAATMETVARIKKLLIDTEKGVADSAEQYEQLEKWGYRNLELEKLNLHAKETQSKLRQIFHSFNMREINDFAGEIQQVVERTQATHDLVARLRQVQREQTLVGIGAVVLLLLFAGLLVYYKTKFLEHHG